METVVNKANSVDKSISDEPRFSLGRLWRLASKELREILRDRRTIITLVLMPLLVYPLLGILAQKFLLNSLLPQDQTVRILVQSEEDRIAIEEYLADAEKIIAASKEARQPGDEQRANAGNPNSDRREKTEEDKQDSSTDDLKNKIAAAVDPNAIQFEFSVLNSAGVNSDSDPDELRNMLSQQVLDQDYDMGIVVERFDSRLKSAFEKISAFEFILNPASDTAVRGKNRILDRFQIRQEAFLADKTARLRFPFRFCDFRTLTFGSPASSTRSVPSLLTFFPLMLVLMTMTGAVYPAIDLTAGERERGTMEILISAPVSRLALLFGKFVAVLAVAMLTAIFNMVAMFLTVYTIGFDRFVFGEAGISLAVILQILFLLFVFAGFFSAVLLSLTSFARSFKEAQAYLIPLMLIALAPGVVSLLPGIELNLTLSIVPLVNMVLLGRDLLTGDADLVLAAVTILSTVFYGLVALSFAARTFGTDAILSGGSGTWTSMFKRPKSKLRFPLTSHALACLAILFPAFIVISGFANRIELPFNAKLGLNALVLIALFATLPLLFSIVCSIQIKTTFRFNGFGLPALAAALLLGFSIWTFVYEIEIAMLTESRLEVLKGIFDKIEFSFAEVPLWLKLVCLALTPAVCEEIFFRGFLLSAFRRSSRLWFAILGSALLFGVFHIVVPGALIYERMLPSTLLGILLAIICVRTGSLFPGMIMHGIHNGLLLTIAHYETELAEWGIGSEAGQQHLPYMVLGGALIPIVFAIPLLLFSKPQKDDFLLDKVAAETTS